MHDRKEPDFDILDIIPERFDSDRDSRSAQNGARRRLMVTAVLAVAALAAAGAAISYVLSPAETVQQASGLPVIKADGAPLKSRPDERGGMDVPNQDKLIYDRLGNGSGEPRTERLLPPPEAPQAPPVQPAPVAAAPAAPPPVAAAPEPLTVEPAKPAAAPAVAVAPVAPPAPVAAAPKAVSGGAFVVQLGALRTQEDADKEWVRLKKANADVLGSLASDIMKVDIAGKGTFFRLRAGPLDDAAAKAACEELGKRKVGCIVAKK